jgi:hypothetical protein
LFSSGLTFFIQLDAFFNSGTRADKSAILMKNVNGDVGNPRSPTFSRAFKIDNHMTSLFSYTNVVQVSFFDLYDDGYLDVLLTLRERDATTGETTYKLVAFRNEYFDDVYFIKMMGKFVSHRSLYLTNSSTLKIQLIHCLYLFALSNSNPGNLQHRQMPPQELTVRTQLPRRPCPYGNHFLRVPEGSPLR